MANFTWIGNSVGLWNTATNWDDLTTGQDPSSVVPGSGDFATFTGKELLGSGTAQYLSLSAAGTLLGTFSLSTVNSYGYLNVGNASTIYVGTAEAFGDININGFADISKLDIKLSNAEFDDQIYDNGTLNITSNILSISNPHQIIVGLGSDLDVGSTIDTFGYFSIESNTKVILTDPFSSAYNLIGAPTIDVNGNLEAANLYIDPAGTTDDSGSPIVGFGTIEVLANGGMSVGGNVESSLLTFQMDKNSNLQFRQITNSAPTITTSGDDFLEFTGALGFNGVVTETPTISSGTQVLMGGNSNTIDSGYNNSGAIEGMTVSGFNSTDDFYVGTISSLSVSPTFDTLVVTLGLFNGTINEGSIILRGDYSGDTFNILANDIITVTEPAPPPQAETLNSSKPSTTITTPINTYGLVGTYGSTPEPVGAALFGAPGTNFTVQNKTLIESDTSNSFAAGIVLAAAGTIQNTGTIIGANGIDIFDAGNTSGAQVKNTSTIQATIGTGIYLQASGTAVNTGIITAAATGITLEGGGYATNSGTISAATGIALLGGTGNYAYNRGRITTSGDGILLAAPGYVSNAGDIIASGTGIRATADASVYNSGSIFGAAGIALAAGGTVTDHGTIIAVSGNAISFATGHGNLLRLSPTAVTTGVFDGGGGELELQAARKTVGNLGFGNAAHFTTIAVDAAAVWDLSGSGTLAATVINNGTIRESSNDRLTLATTLEGTGTVKLSSIPLALDGTVAASQKIAFAGTHEILDLGDPLDFRATIESFAKTDIIDLTGVALSSITKTHFAGGILTLTEATGKIKMTFASPASFGSEKLTLFKDGAGTGIKLAAAAAALPAQGNPWYGSQRPTPQMSYITASAAPGPANLTASWSTFTSLVPTPTINS